MDMLQQARTEALEWLEGWAGAAHQPDRAAALWERADRSLRYALAWTLADKVGQIDGTNCGNDGWPRVLTEGPENPALRQLVAYLFANVNPGALRPGAVADPTAGTHPAVFIPLMGSFGPAIAAATINGTVHLFAVLMPLTATRGPLVTMHPGDR